MQGSRIKLLDIGNDRGTIRQQPNGLGKSKRQTGTVLRELKKGNDRSVVAGGSILRHLDSSLFANRETSAALPLPRGQQKGSWSEMPTHP
jgi:hypothetical protein